MAFRKDNNTNKPKSFTKIAIGLASPEEILEHSSGQVLKPETINYRTFISLNVTVCSVSASSVR